MISETRRSEQDNTTQAIATERTKACSSLTATDRKHESINPPAATDQSTVTMSLKSHPLVKAGLISKDLVDVLVVPSTGKQEKKVKKAKVRTCEEVRQEIEEKERKKREQEENRKRKQQEKQRKQVERIITKAKKAEEMKIKKELREKAKAEKEKIKKEKSSQSKARRKLNVGVERADNVTAVSFENDSEKPFSIENESESM